MVLAGYGAEGVLVGGAVSPSVGFIATLRQREPMIGGAYFSLSRLVLVRFVGGSGRKSMSKYAIMFYNDRKI